MDRYLSCARSVLRPRLRFSVATMLVLVGIAAVFFGIVSNRVRAFRAAVNNVVARGGMICIAQPDDLWNRIGLGEYTQFVHTVHACHEPGKSTGMTYYEPAGEIDWPADDEPFFDDVEPTDFAEEDALIQEMSPGNVNDETLALLAPVGAELRLLDVRTGSLTDDGLRHVASFPKLRLVFLAGSKITDAGAARLATLENIELLDLKDTQVTDATLARLSGLYRLRGLRVTGTQVTPEGIRKLQEALPNLQVTPDPDRPTPALVEGKEE